MKKIFLAVIAVSCCLFYACKKQDVQQSSSDIPEIASPRGAGGSNGDTDTTCHSCLIDYPNNSHLPRSAQVFNENEVLVAADPGKLTCGTAPQFIKVWYSDEHALTLGVRQVVVKTSQGSTTTDYPIAATPSLAAVAINPAVGTTIQSGDQTGNDMAVDGGRPLWPALFITDITEDSTSRTGDWQFGGIGIPPSKVCGTWKGAVRVVDKTKNPYQVSIVPDRDPAKNNWNLGGGDAPPTGTVGDKYTAEVAWQVSSLNLIPGHKYRLQFMVHDGDQNKVGGDVGESCTTIVIPE